MIGKEEKREVEVSALPSNPDCIFCQFYILDSFGNEGHKYKREKKTLDGVVREEQEIKIRGKEGLCIRGRKVLQSSFPSLYVFGEKCGKGKRVNSAIMSYRKRMRVLFDLGTMKRCYVRL